MIVFSNGVKVFFQENMKKDIFVGISNFGFSQDIDNILGIAHLLEHVLISFDHTKFVANASTARSFMSFWCKSIRGSPMESVKELVSWFFNKGQLKNDFSSVNIKNYIRELENEYYFRNELFHCMDILTFINGGDLYNGGRISMLEKENEVKQLLSLRMKQLSGSSVVIFVKQINCKIVDLLKSTFGTLPDCPSYVSIPTLYEQKGKIAMIPSPFYTVMVEIENTLNNVLAILCLTEYYHLIDYETINKKLYLLISFVNEYDYESFLHGNSSLNFQIPGNVSFSHSDDFKMNMYLNFPWISHDIFDYWLETNDNKEKILKSLEENVHLSIVNRNIIVVYPSFSSSIFNVSDQQNHKLVVLDALPSTNTASKTNVISLMKKSMVNKVYVNYSDSELLSFVSFALTPKFRYGNINKTHDGISFKHTFSADDMNTILESDTFIKYSKSRPAITYQFVFLAFFVSGRSIDDILEHRESAFSMAKGNYNKIIFPKKVKYSVTAKSSFVCGILKGSNLSSVYITGLMWTMKRKGLIYSLDHTKLKEKNTYYVFAFSIYPEKAYNFLINQSHVSSYCIILANKDTVENFSSLNKNVYIVLN
ncbi:metalloprotease [Pteropox virus]|uniref:Metalloendopeptidase n=1 Tax=Pteropox virus TaxID=1873698 RepID=A0A1B1MRH1_9POXV|nr:metalloprotease [Pteropox virus]ANS71139.1 metalloprotease [Pteropox virus]